MLLVIDSDNVLYVFRSVAEAHEYLEWQDVACDEYESIDEDGRLYEFVLEKHDYAIRPTDLVDPTLPMGYLTRFAMAHGIDDVDVCFPLSSFDEWADCLDRLNEEILRRRPRGR